MTPLERLALDVRVLDWMIANRNRFDTVQTRYKDLAIVFGVTDRHVRASVKRLQAIKRIEKAPGSVSRKTMWTVRPYGAEFAIEKKAPVWG